MNRQSTKLLLIAVIPRRYTLRSNLVATFIYQCLWCQVWGEAGL